MIDFTPKPYAVLYLFFQPGCPACMAAEPELEAWRLKNGYTFPVIKLNVGFRDWVIGGWSPNATPGYLLMVDNEPIQHHEGTLDRARLKEWIDKGLAKAEKGSRREQ